MKKESAAKRWISQHLTLVQIVLLLLGMLMISGTQLLPDIGNWGKVFLGLGTAFTSSALLALLYSLLDSDVRAVVKEIMGFQSHVHGLGLEMVHLDVGDESIYELFPHANTIDMFYNTGRNTCQRHCLKLRDAIIKNGCVVRILIADPANPFMLDGAKQGSLCPNLDIPQEIKMVVKTLKSLIDELKQMQPPIKAGSLEVRHYSFVPTGSILIVDGNNLRYTPYVPSFHSTQVPIYDCVKRQHPGLVDKYQEIYEKFWKESARSVLKVEFPKEGAAA